METQQALSNVLLLSCEKCLNPVTVIFIISFWTERLHKEKIHFELMKLISKPIIYIRKHMQYLET